MSKNKSGNGTVGTVGVVEATDELFSGLRRIEKIKLEEGQGLRGVFLGAGEVIHTAPDPKTGEVSEINTWLVDLGGGKIGAVMGATQLDEQMKLARVGEPVAIARRVGQNETRRGHRVNLFDVGLPMESV